MSIKCFLHLILLLIFTSLSLCGHRKSAGGTAIDIEDVPHQVSVQNNNEHICSGAIIRTNTVLTVARCLYNGQHYWSRMKPKWLTVRYGSNLKSEGKVVKVYEVRCHEEYDVDDPINDIAVLLTEYLFLDHIIKLAESTPKQATQAMVTGWGVLKGGSPDELQGVWVRIIDQHTCQGSKYAEEGKDITEEMICAAGENEMSCETDIGGSLISYGILVGLISWGRGCATQEHPGVYVNVAKFRFWIEDQNMMGIGSYKDLPSQDEYTGNKTSPFEKEEVVTEEDEEVDKEVSKKIIDIKKVPYQVTVEALYPESKICAGSLIEANIVLTACMCVFYSRPDDVIVRAGSNYYHTGGTRRQVSKFVCNIPPGVEELGGANIAILLLKGNFEFHDSIAKIPLAEYIPKPGTKAFVSGLLPDKTNKLLGRWLKITTYTTCNTEVFLDSWLAIDKELKNQERRIPEGFYCAGINKSKETYCGYGIGGPLVSEGQLIGMIAPNFDTCIDGFKQLPEVFVDVTRFNDWIKGVMQEMQPQGRIVGGTQIDIEKIPYQVSLQKNGRHYCAGSIISPRIILTAAHCVSGKDASLLSVRVGSNYWKHGGQSVRVGEIKVHRNYAIYNHFNDIALVRLVRDLDFDETVSQVSLADSEPEHGAAALVSGWGVLKSGSRSLPDRVQGAWVNIIDRQRCRKSRYSEGNKIITDGMICAAGNYKDACQGDSGGPLVSGGELVGIVSWGKGCATSGYPGVYANVAYYNAWIDEQLQDM